jgi:aryl-alcohol dehydrogenase-like predicted oxidoreductase
MTDTALSPRKLGRSGIEIAPLVFGGNVFDWTADKATSFRLLDAFVAAGFDAIDTADVYSSWGPGHIGGESETVIGEWLGARGRRDDVKIFTKVGWDMGAAGKGLGAAHIATAVEASLTRLNTDYIDLYQSHVDDAETPLEETLQAYARLVEQGKVRAIGASNYTGERLTEALDISARLGIPRYESVQPAYNLVNRAEFEGPLRAACLEHEVGMISYYGLAAGFLTGKYRSEDDLAQSPRGRSVAKYLDEKGFGVLAALDRAVERTGVTMAQVSLAWILAQPGVTAPIVSATKVEQLEEILGATQVVLDAETLAELDKASA